MKTLFLAICVFCIILFSTHSVLSPNPIHNFTLKNITGATKIVLQSTGSKFATWNNNSEIQMYSINGTLLCSNKLTKQVQRLIWPSQYFPIILHFPGKTFSTLNESTCRIIKTLNFSKMVNFTTQLVSELSFVWKKGGPFCVLTGTSFNYEVNLASQSFANTYATKDKHIDSIPQTTSFSFDGKYLIGGFCMQDGTRMVRVWNATELMPMPLKQFKLQGPVTRFVASGDNLTFIGVGHSTINDSAHAFRFDRDVSRTQAYKALALGEGNTVAFFKNTPASLQLVRTGDNSTIDDRALSNSSSFVDADYVNKVMVVLDSEENVLTYDYYPDQDVIPAPDPADDERGFRFWAVVTAVVLGIITLTVVLMYVFRKRLPKRLREKLPNCFSDIKNGQKEPLIGKDRKGKNERLGRKVTADSGEKAEVRGQLVRESVDDESKFSICVQQVIQPIHSEPFQEENEQQPQPYDQPYSQSQSSSLSQSSKQQPDQPQEKVIPQLISDAQFVQALSKH